MIIILFAITAVSPCVVHAEGEDFTDADYWNTLCTSGEVLSAAQKAQCTAYIEHISNQSSDLKRQLEDIESRRAEIASKAAYYASTTRDYQEQADQLNLEISSLNEKISVKEAEIDTKQKDIDAKQSEADALEKKVKARIESAQESMWVNQYLDILMGANSFSDLIRIANGISDINAYDQSTYQELSELLQQLSLEKKELEETKAELDTAKQDVVSKQNHILALKYEAELIEQEYMKQEADLEAQGNKIAGDIDEIKKMMKDISDAINQIAGTAGWTYPVPGAVISAGTWSYPGGGLHLWEDFAAASGTNVYAAGNGVILKSTDGCPAGYLTNSCGYPGTTGGGNQVYLLTKINGGLYAIKYLHLLAGSPVKQGSIVNAGDVIGRVGTSGNSSGPHCHVEIHYLGDAESMTSFAQSWNGNLFFGCGWGSDGMNHRCESGAGAPCRLRPETVFGG